MILNDVIEIDGSRVIEGEIWYEMNYNTTEIHYGYRAVVEDGKLTSISYERFGDEDFSGSWVEDIRRDLESLRIVTR